MPSEQRQTRAAILYSIFYACILARGEPVQYVTHEGGDVSEFRYAANEARSRAKYLIQATQSSSREASVEQATVVKSSCDEGVDKVDVAVGV